MATKHIDQVEIHPVLDRITITVPTVEQALADPLEYEVSHSILGWTLAELNRKCSLLINDKEAARVIRAQKAALVYDGFYENDEVVK